jgi:hypothetical protein
MAMGFRPQQQRRKSRAECERVESRKQRANRNGERELAKKLPADATNEKARNENSAKHQAYRQHRPSHLLHGTDGGLARRKTLT